MLNRHYDIQPLNVTKALVEDLKSRFPLHASMFAAMMTNNKTYYRMIANCDFSPLVGEKIKKGTIGGILEHGTVNVAFDNVGWVDESSVVMGDGLVRKSLVRNNSLISGCVLTQATVLDESTVAPLRNSAAVVTQSYLSNCYISGAAMISDNDLKDIDTTKPLMML